MQIINLTQHTATAEQLHVGVTDLQGSDLELLKELLTFDFPPTQRLLEERSGKVAELARASGAQAAMIGGAPFFMAYLERALKAEGLRVLYAFSVRESTEKVDNGNVRKVAVFRHKVRESYLSDAIIEAKALVAKALKDDRLLEKVTDFGPIAAIDHTDPDFPCPVVVLQTNDGLKEVVNMGSELGFTDCYRPMDKMELIKG